MGGEDNADAAPAFHSHLRAKKEERIQQRQQELPRSAGSHRNFDVNTKVDMRDGPESSSLDKDASTWNQTHRPVVAESGEDAVKRRERADARKRVIEYHGSVWDAVSSNDLDMVRNYFLVEGAPMLLRRRHPDAEQGGRPCYTMQHGAKVAGKTTALIEAARAGHADVCVTLLHHGASPRHRDSYGDSAFHWAGRQGHGTALLQMALEQERLEPGSTPALWVMKNYKSRTVVDLVQPHTFVVPLLQKRLGSSFTRALESAKGKRRSRFPVRHRRSFQYKKKQEWRDLFVKLDDISARLIALTDRSQFEVCWSVYLVGADISTPVPGESSNGIDVDDTPYCFYVRETSAAKDCTHYFSTPTGSTKKAWVKALTQVARDGPRAPRFAASQPGNEFDFQARVVKSRPHVDGTHAVRPAVDFFKHHSDPNLKAFFHSMTTARTWIKVHVKQGKSKQIQKHVKTKRGRRASVSFITIV
ncbi:Ankyrin repeat-containing domain [Phytophthora cactorum]|nr:Ankyrin repeat-containing domain [Phytophthora cactorum]